jgi:hypothetical protein
MRRILVGLVAAVSIAVAGFVGFGWYVQHRAEGEVDTAFAQIRSSGGKADHGKVSFDLRTRTLTIADISGESAAQPPVSVKIGAIRMAGVNQPDAARLSAESIEINDLEVSAQVAGAQPARITYKAPQVTMKDYSGPTRMQGPPAGSSLFDVYRFLAQQFTTVSASSVTMPRTNGTIDYGTAALGTADFIYSGLVIDGIKDGRIASEKLDELTFTMNLPHPAGQVGNTPEKLTGRIANIVYLDIDANAMVAALDPEKARDDRVYRVFRQASTGAYELTAAQGIRMRMDGSTVDDVGLRPSQMQLPALLAAIPQTASPPTPAQARELMEKLAGVYGAVQIANAEMRGLSVETPQGPFKLAAMRFALADGKGDFAIEGLDGRSPQGPVKMGRFALKSFDIAGLMRLSAQFANPAERPAPSQALEFFKVLAGVELKDLVAPYKATSKQVTIDNVSLTWGQLVGPIPTQAHLVAKMAGPVDASNPAVLPLLAAGIDSLALDADLGLGWTEASGAFAIEPLKIELSNLLGASAKLALSHVSRDTFTPDPQKAMAMAAQIETGTLELTLRDLGAVDILIAQYARAHTISRDAARQAIIDSIKAGGDQFAAANPDAAAAVDAFSRFIETPHQTLTLKLSPRAQVPTLQLVQLLGIDPSSALAQFKIEASTGL